MTEDLLADLARRELAPRRDHSFGFARAVWSLLLGEPAAGRDDLRAGLAAPGPPWDHLRLAVVAGAPVPLGGESPSHVAGYREYVEAMTALAQGDRVAAERAIGALARHVAGRERCRSGHPVAIADIPRGIAHDEPPTVGQAIDALLQWHQRRARARSDISNSAHAFVCLDAAAALAIAAHHGLTVDVADAHRAATVPMHLLYVDEHDGRPLPRGTRIEITADLVAGPWLTAAGVVLPPAPSVSPRTRPRRAARPRPAEASPETVYAQLRERVASNLGSPWQLASWALLLDDRASAIAALRRGARDANRDRERFAYELVTADDADLRRSLDALATERQSFEKVNEPYAHADGYLDLIADLISGHRLPTRADARRLLGPLGGAPVACSGLVERDAELVADGLDTMLTDHARALERRSSPPPPICAPAVHIAVAARRLGLSFEVDSRHRAHPTPIPVDGGDAGRLSCDLLGGALWT